VIGANGSWAALAPRSLCDGHHKKALFIAELPKRTAHSSLHPLWPE
jgi:hypothetical protein